jgi:hypothetical protein
MGFRKKEIHMRRIRLSELRKIITSELRHSLSEGPGMKYTGADRRADAHNPRFNRAAGYGVAKTGGSEKLDELPDVVAEFYRQGIDDGEYTKIIDVWNDMDGEGVIEVVTDGPMRRSLGTWHLSENERGFENWHLVSTTRS